MKKILSVILVLAMLFSCSVVFADSQTSSKMEEVLIRVKNKVDIPASLTEFSSYVTERNGESIYHFDWNDEEYENSITVSSDSEGRIISYYNYKNDFSDKRIPSFTKKEIENFAMMFIQRTLPETTRGEGDVLVYNPDSYSVQGNRYSMQFDRKKELVEVKDNYAYITVCEVGGELFVRSLSVNYDYDTDFSTENGVFENYTEKYMEEFPAELIYRNQYKYDSKTRKSTNLPKLLYRIEDNSIGYISAVTGEVVYEDLNEGNLYKNEAPESMEDSLASGGGSRNEVLTPQEIEELKVIEGLVSVESIAEAVKKFPYVDFDDSFVLERSNLSKNDKDKYIYGLYYTYENGEDYRYFDITAEADTGKVLSFYSNKKYVEVEGLPSDEKKDNARAKISEFLTSVAGSELHQCEEKEESINNNTVTRNFVRFVNGVKYISNGVSATYNMEHNCITSFNLNFTEGEFENPENAIGFDKAYEKIREYAPMVPLYIKSGGVYRKVYTLDCYDIEIDAVTGEEIGGYSEENVNYTYSDIEGHWVEEAATKLAEIQVGFDGGVLNPSQTVTQKEFLAFMASGIYGNHYKDYTEDDLYDSFISGEILKEEEKAPDSPVKREDAFVFLIRFAGLEKVAQLSDIYKVSYEDGHLLSAGKIGYAAILSGLGIVSGSGGKLRPTNNVTRAEAITMLYKYLIIE